MRWNRGLTMKVGVLLVCTLHAARGADPLPEELRLRSTIEATVAPTPLQDDASLHAIQFVGSKLAWAVGDRGVIWRSGDSGATWTLVPTPTDGSLRSVCFLTDRVGWVVGARTTPYTQLGEGIVLFTNNGGASWQELAAGRLPRLAYVKFFGMEQGLAVGEATSKFPTGLFATEDGGRTWNAVDGPRQPGWSSAAFLTRGHGIVGGSRGRLSSVGNGRLLPSPIDSVGQQRVAAVTLESSGQAWAVGDGALLLSSQNGGVNWSDPPLKLPRELATLFDFRAVAARDGHAWIAGLPGSIIWHTPDGGATWQQQFTRQTAPVAAITFASDTIGCAVGACGAILQTADGGQTWNAVRGAERHAGLFSVATEARRAPLRLLARESGEYGYRSAVYVPLSREAALAEIPGTESNPPLDEAVVDVGGSSGEIGWRFTLGIPELEWDARRLVEHWNRRTDNRLREVFLSQLVVRLRTWKPSVVVIDEPEPGNALTALVNDATLEAIDQAGRPTEWIQTSELAGLEPWHVEKVYLRLRAGSDGHARLDPHEYLARLGQSPQAIAAPAFAKLSDAKPTSAQPEGYRLLLDRTHEGTGGTATNRLFGDVTLAPGSPARRLLPAFDEAADEARRQLAERERNFEAAVENLLDDPRRAGQMIAQLREVTGDMPAERSVQQLTRLADQYRSQARWDLVEATYVELVERYPDQPAAWQAMRWLLQFWTGVEPAWQRVRARGAARQQFVSDGAGSARKLQRDLQRAALELANEDPSAVGEEPDAGAVRLASGETPLNVVGGQEWRTGAVADWHARALDIAKQLRERSPALYETPSVQFPLASLARQEGLYRLSDGAYRRYGVNAADEPWSATATSELWLLNPVSQPPKPVISCDRVAERPLLDGAFADPCWQNAQELALTPAPDAEVDRRAYPFVLLAHDREHLYVAATIPRHAASAADASLAEGRSHDADLTGFDRLSLLLDVDRDYATHYAIHVDERGCVAESCWEDPTWNPNMFVKASADETHWRIELAIPFSELTPVAPQDGEVWAVGVVRTIPGVGLESWTHPAAVTPRPETFGMVKFRARPPSR